MATAKRVVQRLVNRRAQAKYATFWNSLMQIGGVLDDARKLANRIDDSSPPPWHVADAATVRKAANRVERALEILSKSGKKWEAELISREWRK
jgi:hypothetical protein